MIINMIIYTVYPLKKFITNISHCKYCLKKWKGGGTICICCSIEIQKAYNSLQLQIAHKKHTMNIFKNIKEEIENIGLLPNRIRQTLLGDTMIYFEDFRDKKYIVS